MSMSELIYRVVFQKLSLSARLNILVVFRGFPVITQSHPVIGNSVECRQPQ